MTRAALYCRLSREDEGLEACAESESIQNQRAMLLAWAERLGCQVQGIYCDEDYSGADRDRPAFNRVLAAARAGQILARHDGISRRIDKNNRGAKA